MFELLNVTDGTCDVLWCAEMRSSSTNKKPVVSSLSGGDVVTRRETEAEIRRREIAAAETRRRRWHDGRLHGDDDSFNRPESPPPALQGTSPPTMFSLPADSVILRHRRRCRAHAVAMAPARSSSSSSSDTSNDAGDGDDEDDDRRITRHHRISSRSRYANRTKSNDVSNRSVWL